MLELALMQEPWKATSDWSIKIQGERFDKVKNNHDRPLPPCAYKCCNNGSDSKHVVSSRKKDLASGVLVHFLRYAAAPYLLPNALEEEALKITMSPFIQITAVLACGGKIHFRERASAQLHQQEDVGKILETIGGRGSFEHLEHQHHHQLRRTSWCPLQQQGYWCFKGIWQQSRRTNITEGVENQV